MNKTDWILEADIAELQYVMTEGRLTSVELVRFYLLRIEKFNGAVNAVLEFNPDALAIARELDRERAEKGSRGLLHGIPILLKDNIDTKDRMHTSAGSIALEDSYAIRDSFVAGQLRAAGAVLLGKTNMTEWANYMSDTIPAESRSAIRTGRESCSSAAPARAPAPRWQGAVIVDPVELPCEETEWDGNVMLHEFKKGINDYLSALPESVPVHSLKELIAFNENEQHKETALRYGQSRLLRSEETSGTLEEELYLDSKRKNHTLAGEQGIDHALQEHQLDALLFLGAVGGSDLGARASGIIAPAGYTTKGPQGVTFVGNAYSEPVLIAIACAYEQATKHRVPPVL